MPAEMPTLHRSKLYHQFSRFYDLVFTRLFVERMESTVASLKLQPGQRVLEVGVGTGLSLTAYPRHAEVVGIDLAAEMLEQAEQKIEQRGWDHVSLRQMDALHMDFPDEYFDVVTAFHVVSVVPDPQRLLQEMVRVTKPGGAIVIINHFRSEKRWLAPLIDMLNPVTQPLGWRTNIRFDDIVEAAPLRVERRFKTSNRSLFTVVVARKSRRAAATTA